ncbi:aminoglycoside 3'-phosphotransferase [Paenibacillus sp. EC2-1]|uniref:aminoglycoside 3'-phosphotransferase n=1 Tax=Paenibacillus sp. EC2-1 TaxID=3388665 RepID=UPI003BEEE959
MKLKQELLEEFITILKLENDLITLCWENIASTFYIQREYSSNCYLKIQPIGTDESVDLQDQKLLWLQNKLPVPQIIEKGTLGEFEYLLTEEVLGTPVSNITHQNGISKAIRLAAQGLRTIHEVPIIDCPFDNCLPVMLEKVQRNVKTGSINEEKLKRRFGIKNVESTLVEIHKYAMDLTEDLVFIHGDYSMPNIIIGNGQMTGYLDLGHCGIGERYYDLAVAEKSIIMNFGKRYVDLFYNTYGLDIIDPEKVRYFQVIECLLWG